MTTKSAADSYDVSVFQILTGETAGEDKKLAEKKIRRMLSRRSLGQYDQQRIENIRALRDDLRAEISKFDKSNYYQGIAGKSPLEHFDYDRMVADFSKLYPLVRHPDIGGVIGYAIYYYYLR